jgi:ligand-binding sensor protein
MGNNFKYKYEQLLKAYNESQSIMALIKIVVVTSKGDQFLKASNFTNFSKVMDEGV